MNAERFAVGLTYEQFRDQMATNIRAIDEAERSIELDQRDVLHFQSLKPLRVVAVVEDWCGDVVANLPVVAALSRAVGPTFELRCFLRDQNRDITEAYLNRGHFESMPVFAFFDEAWNDVGVFIERPVAVTERREEERRAIYLANPAFGSPDDSPAALPEDLRATLTSLITEGRQRWRPWAQRQLVLALRDCTSRAPQVD